MNTHLGYTINLNLPSELDIAVLDATSKELAGTSSSTRQRGDAMTFFVSNQLVDNYLSKIEHQLGCLHDQPSQATLTITHSFRLRLQASCQTT